jgi:hypothetical protein
MQRMIGQPVARITPVTPTTGSPLLDRLITRGRAIPAGNTGSIPPTPPRDDRDTQISLSTVLAEMRDDQRLHTPKTFR